ncbi:AMP-binding protein [Limoniibacter endophyticus]|uniref:ATP-dependent acyl-CoA ligase n=1 Tax=Limoniibacter endophyticus TaxID=1565040 RepID=A0A8J3GII9_9HYPH|nr:AMP-binding protein [Limoniibacter endophyticus]GHC78855.1 ATP-dependent acyl-CoA ligase [Limoniibacter endophyticus]
MPSSSAIVPDHDATDPGLTIAQHWSARAATDPEHVYCRFGQEVWTINRMHRWSNRMAHALGGLCPRGSRVALMLGNHPDHAAAIFGLVKAGLVRVPVNVNLIGASLAFVFERFAPTVLIAERAYADVLRPVLEMNPELVVIWRHEGASDCSLSRLLAEASADDCSNVTASDDVIAITPSSGTTGEPKGVLKTDQSLRSGPLGIFALTGATRGDVLLHWEPLYHGAGVAVLIAAVMRPLTLVMVPRFSASQFWSNVDREGITLIHYLGGVLPILLAQPERDDDRSHSARLAWGGGASIEVSQRFSERFGIPMREGFGMSELTTFVTVSDAKSPMGACGKPLPFYEVRLRPIDGVQDGDFGECLAKSLDPGLAFRGYFGRPEAVAELVVNGWFSTGDLMRRDASGNYFYAGRLKDCVRRRGVNISAWEVERVFQGHSGVEECALIGVAGEMGDDDLKLFVKRVEGDRTSAAELLDWAHARMPYFQVPRYLEFIEAFDKTPTQRISKGRLPRDTANAYEAPEARRG